MWKTFVPQTSSRDSCKEKEGAFLTSQEAASSPLRRTLKGGAGTRTKCGWEVAKASQDARFTDLGSQLAFDFLPGDARGEDMKRPSRASVNEKKSILSMVKLSLVAIMKNKNE